jgi:hypothetical protein
LGGDTRNDDYLGGEEGCGGLVRELYRFGNGAVNCHSRHIVLYFTGRQHAGENLAGVLAQRAAELPGPIQMCDALSRNVPKLGPGVEILLLLLSS